MYVFALLHDGEELQHAVHDLEDADEDVFLGVGELADAVFDLLYVTAICSEI